FGIDVARLRVELAGRLFFPASADGDPAVRTRLVYGRIAPCYGWVVLSRCFVVGDVLFARASVDLLFALSRTSFDVGETRVWTLPAVGAVGTFGVGARIP